MWLFTVRSVCLTPSLSCWHLLCLSIIYLLLLPLSGWKSRLYILPSAWPCSSLLNQSQECVFTQWTTISQYRRCLMFACLEHAPSLMCVPLPEFCFWPLVSEAFFVLNLLPCAVKVVGSRMLPSLRAAGSPTGCFVPLAHPYGHSPCACRLNERKLEVCF